MNENSNFAMQNLYSSKENLKILTGTKIDFIVLEIDEIREYAVASRKKAMDIKQKIEFNKHYVGDKVNATVISVGIKHIKINCLGVDAVAIIPIWMNKRF